jgi:transcriptional regulator with XRE-family HTH domain
MDDSGDLSQRIARNVRHLREARALTQQQIARLARLPRATWANLEAGSANPTLSVLHRVASALQVPLDELIATPRAACRFYSKAQLTERRRGDVLVRSLLPDPVRGVVLERMELPPRAQMTGIPHMPGTREYLACESGTLTLTAAGERWQLTPGDVVVFRGDQRHSYANSGSETAVGYSVVLLVPVS